MYKGKSVSAVIAAGGIGQRMGAGGPKQFLKIGDKSLLQRATEAFDKSASIDNIYIVLPKEHMSYADELTISKIRRVIPGGATRQESVYNGLVAVREDCGSDNLVLIHDAARPYVTEAVIQSVLDGVLEAGAAIPAVPVKDTIKTAENGKITGTHIRDTLYSAQTPQGFNLDLITKAHEDAIQNEFVGTDDAQLVERIGHEVLIARGDEKNIKITTPEDLPGKQRRVGLGFDVHAFAEGRDLILGGLKIEYERGLLGHSDADVLVHALMDAMLGALNLGDIGTNFPDTDPEYKDIRSTNLLIRVNDLMVQKGYTLENIDLIIVAEKPKMKDHIPLMRDNLAEILNVDPRIISIKATTTEGLGFTGREEGIGAQAIVGLIKNI